MNAVCLSVNIMLSWQEADETLMGKVGLQARKGLFEPQT